MERVDQGIQFSIIFFITGPKIFANGTASLFLPKCVLMYQSDVKMLGKIVKGG
jgi:hypothetical protein